MDSDEVDYMSDTFLQNVCGKEDIRPGLIKSYAQQYVHKREVKKMKTDEKNRFRNPSLKEKETVSRENALNRPLDNDNVGFKMLQRLGFKPGSGLGRSGEGRVEPISVEVKADRQGLGRKSSLEEIAQLRKKYKTEAREKLLNVDDYRVRKAQEASDKRATVDLMKSQRVCWELDSKECIGQPAETWFWPENKLPSACSDNEEDQEEQENNGVSETLKYNVEKDSEEYKDYTEENEYEEDEDFSVQEKLEMLTQYLRKTHIYCVWCGHSFDDERDLHLECPGPTREDH